MENIEVKITEGQIEIVDIKPAQIIPEVRTSNFYSAEEVAYQKAQAEARLQSIHTNYANEIAQAQKEVDKWTSANVEVEKLSTYGDLLK